MFKFPVGLHAFSESPIFTNKKQKKITINSQRKYLFSYDHQKKKEIQKAKKKRIVSPTLWDNFWATQI